MLVNNKLVNVANCHFGSNTWISIGKLIYSLSNGSAEGYKVWRMFSQIDVDHFNEEFCKNVWNELLDEKNEPVRELPEWW